MTKFPKNLALLAKDFMDHVCTEKHTERVMLIL